jgi:phosphoglycerate dehydrogenase-like enzyme
VDEAALVRALTEGRITGAGLDVLETEPPRPDNPLMRMDNVVMTPHIACHSDRFLHDSWHESVEAVVEMANGRLPASFVNPQIADRTPFKPR